MNLKKIAYYLGIALCLASPFAFGICTLAGLDNTVPLSLMITSNACRICSLEAEMTENTMRRYKMKLYKVTITDQFRQKWGYTVSAKSELDALIELRATSICPQDIVSSIEEVR